MPCSIWTRRGLFEHPQIDVIPILATSPPPYGGEIQVYKRMTLILGYRFQGLQVCAPCSRLASFA